MKLFVLTTTIVLIFCSCGTYRYYHPTANPVIFHNPGEVQIYGDAGSSGFSIKGSAALPANIGITGMYNALSLDYQVREGEAGIGYYSGEGSHNLFIQGGLGFGNNYRYTDSTHTAKEFEGDFIRPFVQINAGFDGGHLGDKLRGDLIFTLKTDYFMYNGRHLTGSFDEIKSNYFLVEPAFTFGLGSRVFRIDMTMGYPMHLVLDNALNSYSNARTFPVTVGVGLRFIFGRDKEES